MADGAGMGLGSALGQTYAKLGYVGMNGEGVGERLRLTKKLNFEFLA